MEEYDLRDVSYEKLNRGYENQWELMDDLFAWLDLRIYFFYEHHQWLGPKNDMRNMMGLVVSREEFEHNLVKAAQLGLAAQLDGGEAAQLESSQVTIRARLERTRAEFPLLRMFRELGLEEFEEGCLVLAYAAALDKKYEKLLAYLQDDITQKVPTTALAVQLFLPLERTMEEYLSRFARRDKFTSLFDRERLAAGQLVLRPSVLEFLSTGTVAPMPGLRIFDGAGEAPSGPLVIGREAARRLDLLFREPGERVICLTGGPGTGKRFQVEHLMAREKQRCVFVSLDGERPEELAQEGVLVARLTGACLCVSHMERTDAEGKLLPAEEKLLQGILDQEPAHEKLFLLSQLPIRARLSRLTVELEVPDPTEEERIALFQAFLGEAELGDGLTVEELAAKFRFSPRQIELACRQAAGLTKLRGEGAISSREMHQCCYRQVVHKLGDLASRVRPAFHWDDVVMPEDQKKLLQHACGHIKFQHQVYYGWGFDRKIAYGRGLSILFAGAPGTGKTMCAQVIANELNMEMYKINISQIVSKYIGETEKNLQAVFTEAKRSNCVLFFDECDALFGKRSEVKDAHDRNANVEVAYLLQQIEEYDGVCILATNLIGNIDEAFMRRITYVVRFPFPDAAMREEIYRGASPMWSASPSRTRPCGRRSTAAPSPSRPPCPTTSTGPSWRRSLSCPADTSRISSSPPPFWRPWRGRASECPTCCALRWER